MRRIQTFQTPREKADFLDASASIDSRFSVVRACAARFADDPSTVMSTYMVARALQHFVRDSIAYVRDGLLTGRLREEFADSAVILQRGYDDCDGKSRLFAALCRCEAVPVRIRPVFNHPDDFVHVQCEVRFPGSEKFRLAQHDGWLVVELILAGCEIGQDVNSLPRGPHGERVLAGPPPPTVIAKGNTT